MRIARLSDVHVLAGGEQDLAARIVSFGRPLDAVPHPPLPHRSHTWQWIDGLRGWRPSPTRSSTIARASRACGSTISQATLERVRSRALGSPLGDDPA
jgi:hypothetical protein